MFQFLLEEQASGGGWLMPVMLILVIVGFYFLLIRPEKKRERAANEMRNALQVGDEITTIGGIIGKVISIKDETFVLETTKAKTHIRFLKSAIRSVDVKANFPYANPEAVAPEASQPVIEATAEPAESAEAVENEEPKA